MLQTAAPSKPDASLLSLLLSCERYFRETVQHYALRNHDGVLFCHAMMLTTASLTMAVDRSKHLSSSSCDDHSSSLYKQYKYITRGICRVSSVSKRNSSKEENIDTTEKKEETRTVWPFMPWLTRRKTQKHFGVGEDHRRHLSTSQTELG